MKRSRAGLVTSGERKLLVLLSAMAFGLLFLPSALVSPQPAGAYKVCSDGNCNHETMVRAALDLYPTEFFNFIQEGATHEDQMDHVYAYSWFADALVTNTHLWDSDRGEDDPVDLPAPAWLSGKTSTENAWQKAKALWSLALGAYANGNKEFAYHYFGHVVHLLGDQTLPTHAHDDPHGPTHLAGIPIEDDAFEEWMRDHADVSTAEWDNHPDLAGPLEVPDTHPDKLFWLLYTANQVADFFASDDVDGDAIDERGLATPKLNTMDAAISSPRTKAQLEDNDGDLTNGDANNDDDRDLSVIRENSYLRGISAIAALYKLFEQTVKQQVTLTVVIDRVAVDRGNDDLSAADFYAKVSIAGRDSQNRGDGDFWGNDDDIDPGWMFGNTVPTSGSVPVRVEIWDNDGRGQDAPWNPANGDDNQYDIDAHGGYGDAALELNVDIAKCLRGEPGAISGDLAGVTNGSQSSACSKNPQSLSEGGDTEDDPSARVSFHVFVSKSPPTADAGGPYTTNEGTDVTLDASGSNDPDNDIVTYAWDFDGDGCDDATGAKPSFTAVGQDGPKTVKLCVTDAVGLTAEDTATVTVNNVAPSISLGSNTPTGENTTVTVTGTISDPGWLDPLSGTISWGDGTGTQALGGTVENVRPDATLPVSVSHTYGDNGTFTAQVCARDDKTTPCTTIALQITNTNPTAAIDLSGAVDVNGTPTVIAHAGSAVGFSGRSTDPGSDDLTLTWAWGDGTASSSTKRRVNPPNDDPAVSPSIQPRDETYALSHTFAGACAYETTFAAVDDDGGPASQTAAVIIVGNGRPNQGAGYWKQQFRFYNSGKGSSNFDAAKLGCYLKIAGYMSRVFDDRNDASTFLRAEDILETNLTSAILELFDQQLLATWLNFANGAMEWNRLVDTNGDKRADTRFLDAMKAAETLRLDPNATRAQLDRQKAIVLSWTTLP
ncbi:MAG TPA: PKD domain-containing protein [Gaiellaceae bacterium]|nr:PKD domain-containing protein [Gaiellaceae bacterium]